MDLQQRYTRWLEPAAKVLAGLRPNTISCVALICGLAAGGCYWATRFEPWLFLVGGLLVAASGVLDSLDGLVARRYGGASRAGDFLDHVFDRLVNIAIMVGLSLSPGADLTLGLGMAVLMVLNSYMGTQIHASFGRRYYSGLGKAEMFVGLVLASIVLALLPEAALTLRGHTVALINILLLLVGLSSVLGVVHRFRLGLRLATGADGQ